MAPLVVPSTTTYLQSSTSQHQQSLQPVSNYSIISALKTPTQSPTDDHSGNTKRTKYTTKGTPYQVMAPAPTIIEPTFMAAAV